MKGQQWACLFHDLSFHSRGKDSNSNTLFFISVTYFIEIAHNEKRNFVELSSAAPLRSTHTTTCVTMLRWTGSLLQFVPQSLWPRVILSRNTPDTSHLLSISLPPLAVCEEPNCAQVAYSQRHTLWWYNDWTHYWYLPPQPLTCTQSRFDTFMILVFMYCTLQVLYQAMIVKAIRSAMIFYDVPYKALWVNAHVL